jgi:hypothetical protein
VEDARSPKKSERKKVAEENNYYEEIEDIDESKFKK